MFKKRRRTVRHSQELAAMQDHAEQYAVQMDIKTSVGSIAYCVYSKLACSPLLSEVVAHEAKGPVRVVFLSVKSSIVHDVLEGIVHQTSSTASIFALHKHTTHTSTAPQTHAPCRLLQAKNVWDEVMPVQHLPMNQRANHINCATHQSVSMHNIWKHVFCRKRLD